MSGVGAQEVGVQHELILLDIVQRLLAKAYIMYRIRIQFARDQVVQAQGASSLFRKRQQSRYSGRTCCEVVEALVALE